MNDIQFKAEEIAYDVATQGKARPTSTRLLARFCKTSEASIKSRWEKDGWLREDQLDILGDSDLRNENKAIIWDMADSPTDGTIDSASSQPD